MAGFRAWLHPTMRLAELPTLWVADRRRQNVIERGILQFPSVSFCFLSVSVRLLLYGDAVIIIVFSSSFSQHTKLSNVVAHSPFLATTPLYYSDKSFVRNDAIYVSKTL